ncbi:FkbM family methyltransferase [Lysobacter sp.]|uniref:FkbM family methyltransferase n=1 Tax=Lysobacter sp. TaxID=72226 RepID=UPI002D6DA23A|nr:FkbM family methyltransferase [Lysobacter sp.]HZX78322.1 FkbM family methyltransferase [Lysobacter sp.]
MTRLVSYAQNFEDVMLWRALGHVEHGSYIDIGAQSPDEDSVSRMFYEQGWRGIHVDAAATYAQELRAARPDEVVIHAAVSETPGTLSFFEMPRTGLSTLDPSLARQHATSFEVIETVVPAVTLDQVLAHAPGEVHWLKVDVEGAEASVLRSWRDSPVRPWVVVVESTLPTTKLESHHEWDPILVAKGYKFVYFDGLNRFYVSSEHPELGASFATPPNVFDGVSLSGTATSTFGAQWREQWAEQERKWRNELTASESNVAGLRRDLESVESARNRLDELLKEQIAQGQWLAREWKQSHESIARLTEQAHRWELMAHQGQHQIALMASSLSWRVTWPIRFGGRALRALSRSPAQFLGAAKRLVKHGARPLFVNIAGPINRRPLLRRIFVTVVPNADARLRAWEQTARLRTLVAVNNKPVQAEEILSVRGQQFLHALRRASGKGAA